MRRCVFLGIAVLGVLVSLAQAEDPVYFTDPNLKEQVERELCITDPTPTDMLELVAIRGTRRGITCLTGLEYATNLKYLWMDNNKISDVSALSGLTKLEELTLADNQISDISALSGLTSMKSLHLGNNQISDISAVAGMRNLNLIELRNNQVSDVSALGGKPHLYTVDLFSNQISDISGLASSTRLFELNVSANQITEVSGIPGMTNLQVLSSQDNQISDISSLAEMTDLVVLELDRNQLSDVSVLAGLPNLGDVHLSNNQISDVSVFVELPSLWKLDLSNNLISDISALTAMKPVSLLYLQGNPLNHDACAIYIPRILAKKPNMDLQYDACSEVQYVLTTSSTNGGAISDPGEGTFTYDAGDSVSVTATPQVNYHFTGWSGTAVDSGKVADAGAASTTVTMDADYTLTANFAADVATFQLVTSSSAGGAVTAPGEGTYTYDAGDSVSVTATPQANYHFTGWSGTAVTAGKVADAGAASTTVTMDGDYTLVAGFASDQHTLTISSSEGGSVTTPGEGAFVCDHGSVVSVEAAGQAGGEFTGWSGTAVDAGKVADADAASTTVTVDADYTLTANFDLVEHTVLLSAGVGGSIIDPGEGSFTYTQGSEIQLEAQPDPGYDFDHWDGGSLWCSLNPFTMTINGDLEIAVVFTAHQCRLTVSSSEGGAVVVPGEGVFTQTQGTSISAVAVPESGYCFAGWSGTLVEGGDVGSLDVGRVSAVVNADATLHASFVPVSTCIYVDNQASGSGENGTWEHPFDTIQEAINVSDDGQTVLVLPGTYDENLTFSGEGITVSAFDMRRSGAISQTIICGSGQGSVVTFADGESANSILSGFTIVGGNAEGGGGIRCIEASPIIANCVIAGNRANLGGGVLLDGGDATLVNCTICDNFGQLDGGGIYATGSGLVTDSILWDNEPQQIATESSAGLSLTYCDVKSGWPGTGNIDEVPCFAAPGYWTPNDDLDRPTEANDVDAVWSGGDYHLKSTAGRWELQSSSWVQDDLTSPCIDAGNPDADAQTETLPNGGRINLGAFGGTVEASMSQVDGAGE